MPLQICYPKFAKTEVEPKLTLLTGEELGSRTVNTTNEARLDIWARGVWGRGQQAFFNLRVFDPKRLPLSQQVVATVSGNERVRQRKRAYNERVLLIEHSTVTPLFFSIYGSMGECRIFKIIQFIVRETWFTEIDNHELDTTKTCFALLESRLHCLRGSQTVCRKVAEFEGDVVISEFISRI